MTNPNDLIRRGEAVNACCKWEYTPNAMQDIINLPAVTDPQIATLQATNARLVEALREAIAIMESVDGENDCSRGIAAAEALLAELETKA